MTKTTKILLSIGIPLGAVAILTPLSIIANQMINSNSVLKLKKVKENGRIGGRYTFSFTRYPTNNTTKYSIDYFYLIATFNHPIDNASINAVKDDTKYDGGATTNQDIVYISQNKVVFFVYSSYINVQQSSSSTSDAPAPTTPAHGGHNAASLNVQSGGGSLIVEFKWSWNYRSDIRYRSNDYTPYYNYSACIATNVEEVSWETNPTDDLAGIEG